MADVPATEMPVPLQIAFRKALGGDPLTLEESRVLLAFSLVRIVQELEHICEALRLTPEEAEGGG